MGLTTERKDNIKRLIECQGVSHQFVCGLMANIEKESSYRHKLLEKARSCGMTDDEYIASALTDPETFINDHKGFGICQWTHRDLKRRLVDYCRTHGRRIDDVDTQVAFAVADIMRNKKLKAIILAAPDSPEGAYQIGYHICTMYEKPARVETSCISRAQLAAQLYNELYKLN